MTIKSTIIGATTAIVIAATSVAVPTTASASPFAALNGAQVETQAAGVVEVKRRRHRGHRRHHHGGVNAGTAAAIGVGALILGAAVAASAANAGPRCRTVRVERWSPRYQAYVIRKERVCN